MQDFLETKKNAKIWPNLIILYNIRLCIAYVQIQYREVDHLHWLNSIVWTIFHTTQSTFLKKVIIICQENINLENERLE